MDYPMVLVEWRDACSNSGAFTEDEAREYTLVVMRTLGYLVGDHPDRVVLAMEHQKHDDALLRYLQAIPREVIISITRLNRGAHHYPPGPIAAFVPGPLHDLESAGSDIQGSDASWTPLAPVDASP